MPIFEYICKECKHQFEVLVHASTKVACPSCSSQMLDKQLSVFAANTKSGQVGRNSMPIGPCGTCGDPRGPGSCSMN